MTSQPVPPGATVVVFAGSSGGTSSTGVTDTQGNTYTLAASSTVNENLQAYTGIAVNGLNPAAGDSWTVTWAASNTQNKNVLAVMVTGCAAADITAAANGNSASPLVTGTAAAGNEIVIACVQDGNAGGIPAFATLASIGGLHPAGQQYTYAGFGYVTRSGTVTVAATVSSAQWAAVVVSLPVAPPVALGSGGSPAGGAQMPPYPVLPNPRNWSPGDMLLTPLLRADPGNALALLANPPLVIAGQTITTQLIPNATVTTLALDTELTDTWQSHAIPARQVYPPLAGWYLAEGFVFLNDTSASSTVTAGIQAWQGGTAYSSDGGKAVSNGTNFPIANVADLVQVNPATDDSIALYCWQDSGLSRAVASAWLKTEWAASSSGSPVTSPAPAAGWTSGGTVLLDAVTAGATTVLVEDPSGIVLNGTIELDTGAAAAENVTVTSFVSGQTVPVSACAYPHPAQAAVAVPVSAAWMNQQVRDKINLLSCRPVARLSSQGTSQSLPSQAWPAGTAVQWSNPAASGHRDVDNYLGWDDTSVTSQYSFPLAGTWLLYGQVYLADASAPVTVSAGIAISGGTIWWGDRTQSAGSTSESICATVRRVVRVTAGQYAEIYGSQGSGGSLAVKGTAASHSRFVAVWRGY
jgi:hypothetical protein